MKLYDLSQLGLGIVSVSFSFIQTLFKVFEKSIKPNAKFCTHNIIRSVNTFSHVMVFDVFLRLITYDNIETYLCMNNKLCSRMATFVLRQYKVE